MTVNLQTPVKISIGNGSNTTFAYSFGALDEGHIYVFLDGVQKIAGSHYTLENVDLDVGGEVEFIEPPDDEAEVVIIRRTPITQQVDYVDGTPFPAETHELGADKLIYILQEWILGVFTPDELDETVDYDLSVQTAEAIITIINNAGTDAVLPPWDSGEDAGVFIGEITESAPADDTASVKPDGYMYIEVLPTP